MRSIGDLDFVIHAIVGAVMFSLLFSIGALLMQTVRERTPELAVLKTVGFTDGAVVAILVVEASLLCVVLLRAATRFQPTGRRGESADPAVEQTRS